MSTPNAIETQFTLLTAVARYERLRTRDALAPSGGDPVEADPQAVPLTREEALELIALGDGLRGGPGRRGELRCQPNGGAERRPEPVRRGPVRRRPVRR